MQGGDFFRPHPNLSDRINHSIAQSEIEGGVYLRDLPADRVLDVQTQNRSYFLLRRESEVIIWGHPVFCPAPVRVCISGSNWGGSMLKIGFIGRGMHLEFRDPDLRVPIVTSRIRDMRELRTSSLLQPGSLETALQF